MKLLLLSRLVFAGALSLVLVGCRSTPAAESIPRYPAMPVDESLALIYDRNQAVSDITGKGTLTFTGADGQSVRLDTVFVLAPPDNARVRAWKFSRAVFDLTRTSEGVWLFLPRGDDRAEELTSSAQYLGDAIGEWLDLTVGRFDTADASANVEGDKILVRRPMRDGLTLRATIDRATLTPRRYEAIDAEGRIRFRLLLDRYRELGPTVWPEVVEAQSASGTVRVDARELELNVAPPSAFVPPRRAQRLDSSGER